MPPTRSADTPSTPLAVTVLSKTQEARDIVSLVLVPAPGVTLPPFTAGAHVELTLPGGWVRSYSLCNVALGAAAPDHYEIAVLKEAASRGGSRAVHEAVQVGDTLTISAPRNLFALAAGAPHSLLMAGGIGITPLLAMAQTLQAQGASFELHHSVRSHDRLAFATRLQASPFAARVHAHVDEAADTALDLPAVLSAAPAGSHLYVCGPKGYMDAVLAAARAAAWPEAALHSELFGAEVAARADDGSFEVVIHSTQQVFSVPADQSVIQVLSQAGIEIPYSCEQGVCGTCITRVKAGVPDHRDLYFTPEEQAVNDQFTPCCSRAKSARLVLDL